jgi:hypothetical protein
MRLLKFPDVAEEKSCGWRGAEVAQFTSACAPSVCSGDISGWEIGETELCEPQLYVIGPPPDYDCSLVVSRVGRLYVLEDGAGNVLFEHSDPLRLADQIYAALRRNRAAITARMAVAWCVAREFFEEKIEPVMAEPIELISHYGSYAATLA